MRYSCVPLGELVTISGGGTPSRNNDAYWGGSIPWATVKDLKDTALTGTQETITPEGLRDSASNLIPAGSVIVATRMGLGKVAINTIDVTINQDLKAFSCSAGLDARYLLYYLLVNASHLDSMGKGATVKGITLDVLKDLSVPLPPLPEQKRIAVILDKADSIRRKRQEAVRLTEELLRSVFLEMFGDPVFNPKKWRRVHLAGMCNSADDIKCGPFGTQLGKDEFTHEGVPLWGIKNVNKFFDLPTQEFLEPRTAKRLIQYSIQPGDIVMTRKGTIGNCAVYPERFPLGIMHSDLLRLRVNRHVCQPAFLAHQLHYSRAVEQQIELISGGAVMPGINVTKLKNLEVLVPPIDIQHVFTHRASAVEKLRISHCASLKEFDTLFNSLLQRAFKGVL